MKLRSFASWRVVAVVGVALAALTALVIADVLPLDQALRYAALLLGG
ncbi:hypothetical protein [Roseospira goensis]|uniref:Type IV secretory pathway component VirB8 n=1 Tax=Roseospira goensis TaxID=391922 RepID=A0A7W6S3T1_9PROT|nr:hypothetical protein [Roseospira goensis]MBB4287830.1 type IV secretory pathway component VirB8 [Roseospira goensis]